MSALCTRAATTRANGRSVWMNVAIEIETGRRCGGRLEVIASIEGRAS
jgi:hypothetical protein